MLALPPARKLVHLGNAPSCARRCFGWVKNWRVLPKDLSWPRLSPASMPHRVGRSRPTRIGCRPPGGSPSRGGLRLRKDGRSGLLVRAQKVRPSSPCPLKPPPRHRKHLRPRLRFRGGRGVRRASVPCGIPTPYRLGLRSRSGRGQRAVNWPPSGLSWSPGSPRSSWAGTSRLLRIARRRQSGPSSPRGSGRVRTLSVATTSAPTPFSSLHNCLRLTKCSAGV